jgi:hypothetical protein
MPLLDLIAFGEAGCFGAAGAAESLEYCARLDAVMLEVLTGSIKRSKAVVRFVTVLQKFLVNVLFAWLTQTFVAVSTVGLLEVFRVSKVLQLFPNERL